MTTAAKVIGTSILTTLLLSLGLFFGLKVADRNASFTTGKTKSMKKNLFLNSVIYKSAYIIIRDLQTAFTSSAGISRLHFYYTMDATNDQGYVYLHACFIDPSSTTARIIEIQTIPEFYNSAELNSYQFKLDAGSMDLPIISSRNRQIEFLIGLNAQYPAITQYRLEPNIDANNNMYYQIVPCNEKGYPIPVGTQVERSLRFDPIPPADAW